MATKPKPGKEGRKGGMRRAGSGIHNISDIFEKSFEFEVPDWVRERFRMKFKDQGDQNNATLNGMGAVTDAEMEGRQILKDWDAQRQ